MRASQLAGQGGRRMALKARRDRACYWLDERECSMAAFTSLQDPGLKLSNGIKSFEKRLVLKSERLL